MVSFNALSKLLVFSKRTWFSFFILGSLVFFSFASFGLMLSAAKKPVKNNSRRRKNGCAFILSCLYPDTEKERSKGALSSRVCCSNVCSCISQTKRLIRLITGYHQWSQLHLSMERLNSLSTSSPLVVFGGGEAFIGKFGLLFL